LQVLDANVRHVLFSTRIGSISREREAELATVNYTADFAKSGRAGPSSVRALV
jgi:hypothetical protein